VWRVAHRGAGPAHRTLLAWASACMAGSAALLVFPLGGGCRTGGAARLWVQSGVGYNPEWLSPDGRLLLLDTGLVLDVSTGAEVWRAPVGRYRVSGAGWSPTSDAICYVRGAGGSGGVLYSKVPDGEPVPLVGALPGKSRECWLCTSFGRSSQEVVVGAGRPGLPGNEWSAYYVCRILERERRAVLTATLELPPRLRPHMPVQMVRIGAGERVLVVNGPPRQEGAIFVLDLAHLSVAVAVTERTPALQRRRLHWGDQMEDLPSRLVVPDGPRHGCVLGLGVGGPGGGCELFGVAVDGQPSVEHLGLVRGGLRPPAVLPGGRGFVIPVLLRPVRRPASGAVRDVFHLEFLDAKLSTSRGLTGGAVRDDSPVWSAAARRVVFRRDRKEIWSVSLQGGDARRVWPSPPRGPRHSRT
jgi:hypothetical protein